MPSGTRSGPVHGHVVFDDGHSHPQPDLVLGFSSVGGTGEFGVDPGTGDRELVEFVGTSHDTAGVTVGADGISMETELGCLRCCDHDRESRMMSGSTFRWGAEMPPQLKVKTKVGVRPTGYAPGGITYPKPKPIPKPKFYNPQGYVRGGAPLSVAKATQAKAMGTAGMVAAPYTAPPGTTFQVAPAAAAAPSFQDYINAGIAGDWEVQGAQDEFGARMGQLRGGLQENLRQALISLGLTDPSKLEGFGSYIDADTITKAAQNKYSTTAQIAQQEQKANAQSQAALAARGILSSGQTTTEAEEIASEGERGRFAALQQFLGAGRTGLEGLTAEEARLRGQIINAQGNAGQRLAQQYGWEYPEPEAEAEWNPVAEAAKLPAKPAYTLPKVPPKPAAGAGAARALALRSAALNKKYGLPKKPPAKKKK